MTSAGEERLERYLRFCDILIIWGFGSGGLYLFGWHTVKLRGLALGFVTVGSVLKLGGVVVAYLVMSSRTPNAEIAPWIRQWTRTTCLIGGLAALWALIVGPDAPLRLLALLLALACVILFRRVGPLAIGELGTRWGHSHATWWMFPGGFLGPTAEVWLTAAWLVLAIVVRTSMPSLFRPSAQKVHADQLRMRVLAVTNAQSRYHREHGGYSSDLGELRRLGSSLIDSLLVVTADEKSYRAIARDPGGQVACGLWSVARFGEKTPLQIDGARPDDVVCWSTSDSTRKAR